MSYSLPKTNGLFHLSCPTGKYRVGCLDIFSKTREGKLPLLFRLYYPSAGEHNAVDRWPAWLPHSRYSEAYVSAKWPVPPCRNTFIDRLKQNISVGTVSLLSWLLRWVSGNPRICATEANRPLNERFPVVLFSHGLIACRTTYSTLCTDIASQGYYVAALEHGDSSACVRMMLDSPDGQVTWLEREELPQGAPEGELRARQLDYREKEIVQCLDSLRDIDKGDVDQHFIKLSLDGVETEESNLGWFKGLIATDKAVICGHSMGGATTVRCLANHGHQFTAGIAFDSWMFPVREDKNLPNLEKLMFVNYERFQGEKNLTTMKKYETELSHEEFSSNVITIKKARHYACTDILVAFQGTRLGRLLFGAQDPEFNSYDGLITNSELFHAWVLKAFTGNEQPFFEAINKRKEFLFHGITLKAKQD
eukprot:TRINITY_DN17381_c0_g1_i12.p1 TRINITY_DN17381_c0_g1~~TRINITY_DN17381_c0_g1_i12.p1  ORF type:complete len:421 (-),score=75.94 TRINITY_DN17381_c0_g1_i12:191-1453(-)